MTEKYNPVGDIDIVIDGVSKGTPESYQKKGLLSYLGFRKASLLYEKNENMPKKNDVDHEAEEVRRMLLNIGEKDPEYHFPKDSI